MTVEFIFRTDDSSQQLNYSKPVKHTVFCLPDGAENLFLGKLNSVLKVDTSGVVLEVIIYKDDYKESSTVKLRLFL